MRRAKDAAQSAAYVARFPEKAKAFQVEYARRKAGEKAKKAREWREGNPEKYRASLAASREKHKESNARRASARHFRLMQEDAKFALNARMSASIRHALRGRKSGRPWESLVGYTLAELVKHLEKQFTKGMTWDNRSDWHIDHILPVSSFNYETPDDPDFKTCWAITNLRPLWASDNMSKSAKVLTLL